MDKEARSEMGKLGVRRRELRGLLRCVETGERMDMARKMEEGG